jgi:protein CMS1
MTYHNPAFARAQGFYIPDPNSGEIAVSMDESLQEPLLEPALADSGPDVPYDLPSRKRKRTTEVDLKQKDVKKGRKRKQAAIDEDELDHSLRINKAFAHMDNRLLADYMAQRTRKFESDLSSVELEDRYIAGNIHKDQIQHM